MQKVVVEGLLVTARICYDTSSEAAESSRHLPLTRLQSSQRKVSLNDEDQLRLLLQYYITTCTGTQLQPNSGNNPKLKLAKLVL